MAAFSFAVLIWLLFRTLRLRIRTKSANTSPYNRDCTDRYLYSVWHDSMVMPVFGGKHWCTTALTSQHRDGSFVANVLRHRNIESVRGSTNRIRTGAVRELMQTVASRHLVITPDGPRGPNRSMSPGIAYLASRTGRAVVPSGFACSSCWRWKGSWSDLIIPKPFATVVLLAGDPIHVPRDISTSDLDIYVQEIQSAMDKLDREAWAEVDGQEAVVLRMAPSGTPAEHSRAA